MIIDKSEELSYKGNTGTACGAGMHSLQENHDFTSDFSEIRFYQSVEVLCRSLVFCLVFFCSFSCSLCGLSFLDLRPLNTLLVSSMKCRYKI